MPIRPAKPADFQKICQLLADCNLPDSGLPGDRMSHFLVAGSDPIVGCVGLEIYPPHALLRSLAVQDGHRGYGLGSRLLAAAEDRAQRLGIRSLYLLTVDAAGFFASHGYSSLDREAVPTTIADTSEFSRLCPASAGCMTKSFDNRG